MAGSIQPCCIFLAQFDQQILIETVESSKSLVDRIKTIEKILYQGYNADKTSIHRGPPSIYTSSLAKHSGGGNTIKMDHTDGSDLSQLHLGGFEVPYQTILQSELHLT